MKARIIVLLAIADISNISFTFKASNKLDEKSANKTAQPKQANEPLGGFVSEDKF